MHTDTEIEEIPNEFESESLTEEEVPPSQNKISNITHEVSPEKAEDESMKMVRVSQSRPAFIDDLEAIPKRSRMESKKQSMTSTCNQSLLMDILSQSKNTISLFRKKQSFVHETRSHMMNKPMKSYRRSPERIIEIETNFAQMKGSTQKFTTAYDRKKIYKKCPSLLNSRRKLSPVRETERDDFIDTADLILNKEIEVIKKLTKLKEKKVHEIEAIASKTQEERIKLRRAEELRPKIHKKIQREKAASRYAVNITFSETQSYIDDIIFLIQKEQMAKTEFEQEYITPMLGRLILKY